MLKTLAFILLITLPPSYLYANECATCHSTAPAQEDKADDDVADDDPAKQPVKKHVSEPKATAPGRTDRCNQYRQDVRTYVSQYMGINFPWHFQMGCMEQESNCRADVVSFDNGIGLFQLTPSTGVLKEVNKDLGVIIDPYNPKQNIRAGVYYVSKILKKNTKFQKVTFGKKKTVISPKTYTDKCGLKLADVYQFYNGGYWYYFETYKAGYSCDRKIVRTFCTRGGAWTDKEKTDWLSFCDVNYEYPEQIERRGNKYKMFEFPDFNFF